MQTSKSMWATGLLSVMISAPVSAQPRTNLSPGSLNTGGNHLPQTGQPRATTTSDTVEANNYNVRYNVVPIGVLPGKTVSFLTVVRAVNNFQHVTGYSYIYSGNIYLTGQGFIWQNGELKPLPLLSGWPAAFAFGINDRDQVVGTANNADASGNILQTAVLWDHGHPVNLGTLQPNSNSVALDVNIWGVVVGISDPFGADFDTPVVWSGGTVHELPLLPGESGALAEEINDLGVIAGYQEAATNLLPCLWYWNGTGYAVVNLGNLGGNYDVMQGVNNLTQAVGAALYAGNNHGPAILWIISTVCKLCLFCLRTPMDSPTTSTISARS